MLLNVKVVERDFERRIRAQVSLDGMQFGFVGDRGTTDAIYHKRATREVQREEPATYLAFVDLEKAFDRI